MTALERSPDRPQIRCCWRSPATRVADLCLPLGESREVLDLAGAEPLWVEVGAETERMASWVAEHEVVRPVRDWSPDGAQWLDDGQDLVVLEHQVKVKLRWMRRVRPSRWCGHRVLERK